MKNQPHKQSFARPWQLIMAALAALMLIGATPIKDILWQGVWTNDANAGGRSITNLATVQATNFVGNGSGLTNVTAAYLTNSIPTWALKSTNNPTPGYAYNFHTNGVGYWGPGGGGGGGATVSPFLADVRLTTFIGTGSYDSVSSAVFQDGSANSTTVTLTGLYGPGRLALYVSGNWVERTNVDVSVDVTLLTQDTLYDVFAYDSGGAVLLQTVAWTDDDTRATGLTVQNGVVVKIGAPTHRYVGTFRAILDPFDFTTICTADHVTQRLVWSMYNRVERASRACVVYAGNHNYTTETWRIWSGAELPGENMIELVVGLNIDPITATVHGHVTNGSNFYAGIGVGFSAESALGSSIQAGNGGTFTSTGGSVSATYVGPVGGDGYATEGYHKVYIVQSSEAVGTTSWKGASSTVSYTGMTIISKQ